MWQTFVTTWKAYRSKTKIWSSQHDDDHDDGGDADNNKRKKLENIFKIL